MTLGTAYWILMLIGLLFWGLGNWGGPDYQRYGLWGGGLLTFLLFLLVGWKVFGAPLHG